LLIPGKKSASAYNHEMFMASAVARGILSAPKAAAKAAAEARQSARPAAEASIVAAVQDCLHFMGVLKLIMPVLSEGAALDVAEQLLQLFPLSQPMLSQTAADCLLRFGQGAANTQNISAPRLQLLLKACPLHLVLTSTLLDMWLHNVS
jgi:hypothetical protein